MKDTYNIKNTKIFDVTHDEILALKVFKEYVRHFPIIEQNTLESISQYKTHEDKGAVYTILGSFDENNHSCIGGCYYWWFSDIDTIIIEFIFTNERYRHLGISKQMLQQICRSHVCPIIIEVDKGSTVEAYWSNQGFSPIEYDYVQPAIISGNAEYHGLRLWTNKKQNSMSKLDIDDIIINHYWKYAFA